MKIYTDSIPNNCYECDLCVWRGEPLINKANDYICPICCVGGHTIPADIAETTRASECPLMFYVGVKK